MVLNYFTASSLINAFTSFFLCFFLLLRSPRTKINLVFSLFTFVVGFWAINYFFSISAHDEQSALFFYRALMMGAIFIPPSYLHFVCLLLGIYEEKKKIVRWNYWASLLFALSNFTPLFISGVSKKECFDFFGNPGLMHHPFFAVFIATTFYSHFLMFKGFHREQGIRANQIKYILLGTLIGFIGGSTNFFLVYNIPILPIGNCLVSVYILTVAIAILKYRILDIKLVFTRTSIFLTVYTLVLGFPIWVGLKLLGVGPWLWPVILMGILATAGPFIYLFIQKRAEDRLLEEQRRYQKTLSQASAGMGKIKDLKKLLNLIVYIVIRAVRLDHALVYMYDQHSQYVLAAFKHRRGHGEFVKAIPRNVILIDYLIQTAAPIVYEEIKQSVQDYPDPRLAAVEQIVGKMGGALVFPIFIETKLIAIIVLGKKESGKSYTGDDLSVFSILANQAALAIENAQFYEDMKRTQEQLFQAEKMATIGTMADGLSHQINNRFHALGFIAGDALDTIKMTKDQPMPDKLKEVMSDLERALFRIQENVVQGGEIVRGLLKYTRKGDAGFTAVDFDQAFNSAYEMAQFKIKTQDLKVVRAYDPALIPKIKGNFTQLQEVFFNLIDNGYDAMMQRKNEQKEPDYQPTLTVRVACGDGMHIVFEDNGIGVKEEDMHKLFTPFFTTKLSSKKGTGLGLYVIKKIIEDNHKGTVRMSSQYMVGTQMKLWLPVAAD